jgi:hypothetical protein
VLLRSARRLRRRGAAHRGRCGAAYGCLPNGTTMAGRSRQPQTGRPAMYSKYERRRHPRTKVDRPARVVLPAGTIPCRIKDVSDGGARLETKASSWLPPTFELEDVFSGMRRAAKLHRDQHSPLFTEEAIYSAQRQRGLLRSRCRSRKGRTVPNDNGVPVVPIRRPIARHRKWYLAGRSSTLQEAFSRHAGGQHCSGVLFVMDSR